jgi:hypothetical protein
MKSLQEQYNLIKEGKGDIFNFKRNAIMILPKLVNNHNSYEDIVKILSNKSIIKEAITDQKEQEKIIFDADRINSYELEKGISFEMKQPVEVWKMAGSGKFDISEEDYLKAKKEAIKNIQTDPLYYTRMLTGQKKVDNSKRTDIMRLVDDKSLVDKNNGLKPIPKAKQPKKEPKVKSTIVIKEHKSIRNMINLIK